MVRGVLQGITPIDNHLEEVERGMLEAFELTENMKATEEISIDITKEDLQLYWKKVKDNTESSISQLHFGNYKAAALDEDFSEAHAMILHIVCKLGH